MFLWLKPNSKARVQQLVDNHVIGDLKVENGSDSGQEVIKGWGDIGDLLTPKLPMALRDLVDKVTAETRIYAGFRREGVYSHGGVTLEAKMGSGWQAIKIIGSSVEAVNEAYSLLRKGQLEPVEDWEAPAAGKEKGFSVSVPDFRGWGRKTFRFSMTEKQSS